MFVAPLLKLRDKITRKRHALTEDAEKPFLEHLDDLRKTLTRIIITLVIAVIACFVFNKWFFEVVRHPLKAAGLLDPKERNLPAAIADMKSSEQQPAWWRIHDTARGMSLLEGQQREIFVRASAPDDFTRRFAEALLIYHAADILPEGARADYIAKATAATPPADSATVADYVAQLLKAGTTPDIEKTHDFVETEAFAPAETFMLSMKLSLFAGIIVSFPLLFYFLLEFVLPGLTARERKLMFPALSIGFGLFLAGVLFAFFFVIPRALEFFHEYSTDLGIKDRWRIGQYISFVVTFSLIFGFAFELPVVVMVMVKLGLLTSGTMRRTRGWAVIIILIASAILTPTGDAFTMSLLAAPMIIMYEVCIWLAVLHEHKERKREEEEQRQDQARRAALIGVASVQANRSEATGADETANKTDGVTGGGAEPAESSGALASTGHHEDQPTVSRTERDQSHHAEQSGGDSEAEYEQYLRDHAHLYSPAETHPESIPVEERELPHDDEPPPASREEIPPREPTSDIPTEDAGEPKDSSRTTGPM